MGVDRVSLWLALAASCLAGCSGEVRVPEALPPPLVERLPLRVALHVDPAFSGYVYREARPGDRDWSIDIGAANAAMLDTVAAALFSASQRVGSVATASSDMADVDAVLSPSVDAVEFSVPSQSATDYYAVWIRYKLDVYGRDGALVASWPVSAYGQSGGEGLSAVEAMQRATQLAVRDAAATVVTGFARQARIREALLANPGEDSNDTAPQPQ
jgi:hypothetical protein